MAINVRIHQELLEDGLLAQGDAILGCLTRILEEVVQLLVLGRRILSHLRRGSLHQEPPLALLPQQTARGDHHVVEGDPVGLSWQ
jgi:hypothetical protein